MSEQVIKLSDNAVSRIKEIMSKVDGTTIGVRESKGRWLQACLM